MSKLIVSCIAAGLIVFVSLGFKWVDGDVIPWLVGAGVTTGLWVWTSERFEMTGLVSTIVWALIFGALSWASRFLLNWEDGYDVFAALVMGVLATFAGGVVFSLFGGGRPRTA